VVVWAVELVAAAALVVEEAEEWVAVEVVGLEEARVVALELAAA
jgi:hypothetical protein